MDINIRTAPLASSGVEATIIELIGEVSYNTAPAVEAQVLPLAQPQARLILDMTQVSYMSSAGLRMLLSLYRQVTANEGQIVLVGLIEEIKDAMSITGFLDFFTSCDTLDAGLAALQTAPAASMTP
jgi:anti-sigma B factor antagonist